MRSQKLLALISTYGSLLIENNQVEQAMRCSTAAGDFLRVTTTCIGSWEKAYLHLNELSQGSCGAGKSDRT